jgi:flagellar motor switch protein FliG
VAKETPSQALAQLPAASADLLPAAPGAAELDDGVTGARKAAVLMAGLGSERAANVLQRLREDEIENLSVAMATLSSVGADVTESVFSELAGVSQRGEGAEGGLDFAREVIERALGPERAAELLGRLSGSTGARPFEFLRAVSPERIAGLLRNESPQTIALVLASLGTSQAAGVLSRLPESEQPDIALRIARMGQA